MQFTPAALKSFWHPGGGGIPIFDGDSEGGGYQNVTETPRGGGEGFFMGTFPKKYHSPLTRNSEQSLIQFFFLIL